VKKPTSRITPYCGSCRSCDRAFYSSIRQNAADSIGLGFGSCKAHALQTAKKHLGCECGSGRNR
jgi:hypothetical protein